MKIAIVITKSEAGGAQSHVLELIDGLTLQGHLLVIAVGDEGWLTAKLRSRGIDVTIVPDLVHPIKPIRDIKAMLQLRRWIKKVKPDLIHAHSSKAGLVGRLAAYSLGLPSVFTAHGWAFTTGASFTRKLVAVPSEWIAARTGGDIICVSEFDRVLASRFRIAPDERLHTIWNGINDISDSKSSTSNKPPIIAMVARFAAPKDHSTLLHAAASIPELSWKLHLIGDGPLLDGSISLAESLGIRDRVEFLGARTDVAKLLSTSEIFVLSSRFEGLPISILEAMRAGLPVIASNVGGVSELVNNDTGVLVSPNDPEALSSALRELIASPDVRNHLGSNGRIRYEKYFRSEIMLHKTTEVYKCCISRSKGMA